MLVTITKCSNITGMHLSVSVKNILYTDTITVMVNGNEMIILGFTTEMVSGSGGQSLGFMI